MKVNTIRTNYDEINSKVQLNIPDLSKWLYVATNTKYYCTNVNHTQLRLQLKTIAFTFNVHFSFIICHKYVTLSIVWFGLGRTNTDDGMY